MDILLIGLIGTAIYFGPDYLDKMAMNQKQEQVEVAQDEALSGQLELNNLSKQYDPLNPDAIYVGSSTDEVELVEINIPTHHQPASKKNKVLGGITSWYDKIRLESKAKVNRHAFVRNRSHF